MAEEEDGGVTLILLTTVAPDPLAEQLSNYGHQVFEVLAISEVLALAETYARGAPIIITADVTPEKTAIIQQHYPTMHLKPNATVHDIVWELSNFRDGQVVQ
jgi:hypothetical protein